MAVAVAAVVVLVGAVGSLGATAGAHHAATKARSIDLATYQANRSVSMGFGLEGVNGNTGSATRQQVAAATLNWLLDRITFGPLSVTPKKPGKDERHVTLTLTAASSVGAELTKFKWDFGDGKSETTGKPTAHHDYKKPGSYIVRVEATDDLGHRAIDRKTVEIGG